MAQYLTPVRGVRRHVGPNSATRSQLCSPGLRGERTTSRRAVARWRGRSKGETNTASLTRTRDFEPEEGCEDLLHTLDRDAWTIIFDEDLYCCPLPDEADLCSATITDGVFRSDCGWRDANCQPASVVNAVVRKEANGLAQFRKVLTYSFHKRGQVDRSGGFNVRLLAANERVVSVIARISSIVSSMRSCKLGILNKFRAQTQRRHGRTQIMADCRKHLVLSSTNRCRRSCIVL